MWRVLDNFYAGKYYLISSETFLLHVRNQFMGSLPLPVTSSLLSEIFRSVNSYKSLSANSSVVCFRPWQILHNRQSYTSLYKF
jgi:hypothetical protein